MQPQKDGLAWTIAAYCNISLRCSSSIKIAKIESLTNGGTVSSFRKIREATGSSQVQFFYIWLRKQLKSTLTKLI